MMNSHCREYINRYIRGLASTRKKNIFNLIDTFKHQGLRKQLISLLKDKGILDFKVLEAMNRVPRHLFLDSSFK